MPKIISSLHFFVLSFVATFSYNDEMTDSYILPKWLYTLEVATIGCIFFCISMLFKSHKKINIHNFFLIIIFVCFIQSIYAIIQATKIQPSNFSLFITGSFDNPAGLSACICMGVPLCIYYFHKMNNIYIKIFFITILLIIISALILSESRTGILAGIIFPSLLWFFKKHKGRTIRGFLIFVFLALLSLMYYYKKDSADGRFLILHCCWEMFKDKPIIGYGFDGISANYMNYQAKWLSTNPNVLYELLADNIKHVFNEFIYIVICFGVIGLILLFLIIGFLIRCYYKNPTAESKYALLSLAIISIFSIFSYPFTYPFTWIIFIFNSYILVDNAYKSLLHPKTVCIIILFLSVSSFLLITQRIYAEIEWGKIARSQIKNKELFIKYESLMPIMKNNPYFLYNYSVELFDAKEYDKALDISLKCRNFWADYDLELLLGDLYEKEGLYDKALNHYILAQKMCPNRFLPLYKQFLVYKKRNELKKMIDIGNIILTKKIKIPSNIINYIINDVNFNIQNLISINHADK